MKLEEKKNQALFNLRLQFIGLNVLLNSQMVDDDCQQNQRTLAAPQSWLVFRCLMHLAELVAF